MKLRSNPSISIAWLQSMLSKVVNKVDSSVAVSRSGAQSQVDVPGTLENLGHVPDLCCSFSRITCVDTKCIDPVRECGSQQLQGARRSFADLG